MVTSLTMLVGVVATLLGDCWITLLRPGPDASLGEAVACALSSPFAFVVGRGVMLIDDSALTSDDGSNLSRAELLSIACGRYFRG